MGAQMGLCCRCWHIKTVRQQLPPIQHPGAILPGLTHYNLAVSPLFAAVTLDFLDGQPA